MLTGVSRFDDHGKTSRLILAPLTKVGKLISPAGACFGGSQRATVVLFPPAPSRCEFGRMNETRSKGSQQMLCRKWVAVFLVFFGPLLCVSACDTAQEQAATAENVEAPVASMEPLPEALDVEGFQAVLAMAGNVYVAGQPSREALDWLKAQGVTTVVNLRTQPEMDNRERVPYDEAAALDSLGLEYVHIPLGGDENPYTPEAVARFAEAVEAAEGKVLLHCTVGWRASHMWAAYLVRYRGMELNEAIAHGRAINLGTLPVEELLGADIEYVVQ